MKTSLLIAVALTLTATACTTTAPRNAGYGYDDRQGYSQSQRCYDCGTIERIETVYGTRSNNRTGAVLGGVIGAVAAREVPTHGSQGNKNTATVAGAVVGALAGNAIQNKVNEESFEIHVRMDDGRRLIVNRNSLGNDIREGSYVRVEGNRLIPLR